MGRRTSDKPPGDERTGRDGSRVKRVWPTNKGALLQGERRGFRRLELARQRGLFGRVVAG